MMSSLLQLEPYRPSDSCGFGFNSQELHPYSGCLGDDVDLNTRESIPWALCDRIYPPYCQQAKLYDVEGSFKERVLNDVIEMEMELKLRRYYHHNQQQHVSEQLSLGPFGDNDVFSYAAVSVNATDSVDSSSNSSSSCRVSSSSSSASGSASGNDDTDEEDSESELSPPSSPSEFERRPNSLNRVKVRTRKRKRQLYLFLQEILEDPNYNPAIITWVARSDNIFRFVQPKMVAELWGKRRHREGMTYEHLSRAMRYYYSRGVMKRAPNHGRLVYQFL